MHLRKGKQSYNILDVGVLEDTWECLREESFPYYKNGEIQWDNSQFLRSGWEGIYTYSKYFFWDDYLLKIIRFSELLEKASYVVGFWNGMFELKEKVFKHRMKYIVRLYRLGIIPKELFPLLNSYANYDMPRLETMENVLFNRRRRDNDKFKCRMNEIEIIRKCDLDMERPPSGT